MVFTLLQDGDQNQIERALEWAEAYGADHPILFDIDQHVTHAWADGDGKPRYAVIDRELTVVYRGRGEEGQSESFALVESLLTGE